MTTTPAPAEAVQTITTLADDHVADPSDPAPVADPPAPVSLADSLPARLASAACRDTPAHLHDVRSRWIDLPPQLRIEIRQALQFGDWPTVFHGDAAFCTRAALIVFRFWTHSAAWMKAEDLAAAVNHPCGSYVPGEFRDAHLSIVEGIDDYASRFFLRDVLSARLDRPTILISPRMTAGALRDVCGEGYGHLMGFGSQLDLAVKGPRTFAFVSGRPIPAVGAAPDSQPFVIDLAECSRPSPPDFPPANAFALPEPMMHAIRRAIFDATWPVLITYRKGVKPSADMAHRTAATFYQHASQTPMHLKLWPFDSRWATSREVPADVRSAPFLLIDAAGVERRFPQSLTALLAARGSKPTVFICPAGDLEERYGEAAGMFRQTIDA